MRSFAIVAAAFAASAVAVPLEKREDIDVVTTVDIVYTTDLVTVTAGAPSVAYTTTTVGRVAPASHGAHHHHHHHPVSYSTSCDSSTVAPSSTVVVAPTSTQAPPPPPPPPSTTSEAPVPTSTYVAPTTSQAPPPPSSYSPPPAPPTSTPAPAPAPAPAQTNSLTDTAFMAKQTGGSVVGGPQYTQALVDQHNAHRLNHSAPTMTYNPSLASIASEIAASCTYAHNTAAGGGGYGQNIAAGTSPEQVGQIITNEMYNGEINWFDGLYNQANPDMSNFDHWGHFSQIVWKGTTEFGCWTQTCMDSNGDSTLVNADAPGENIPGYFTVCNYGPPGNVAGEYGANIAAPKGHAAFLVS